METLNRQRVRALRDAGINVQCLYFRWGAGIQNSADPSVFITDSDIAIKHILDHMKYDFIVVTTDHRTFPKFRLLGYSGKFILEIQGYGPMDVAWRELTNAAPEINGHASALLHPNTPHIGTIFKTLYPHLPHFTINNCFDSDAFTYRELPRLPYPVLAWIGRIEDNKNWREFLAIGARMAVIRPDIRLWMFEDPSLSVPSEREDFERLLESDPALRGRLTLHANVPNVKMQEMFSMIGDSGGMLVSTSKVEGGPYCVLEAMSCRCPVLATNSDGVTSAIFHNATGKLYPLGNVDLAIQEICELMYDAVLREVIRLQAQYHVRTEFHPAKYAGQFIQMLHVL